MPVIGVRKSDAFDMMVKVADQSLWQGLFHQTPGSLKTLDRKRRIICDEISHPLVVNLIRPTRIIETIRGGLDKDVTLVERIKDAGVANGSYGSKHHNGRADPLRPQQVLPWHHAAPLGGLSAPAHP